MNGPAACASYLTSVDRLKQGGRTMSAALATQPQAARCRLLAANARAGRHAVIVHSAAQAPVGTTDRTVLGKSGLEVSSVGLGAWSWGDRSRYWQTELDKPSNLTAYKAMVKSGIEFLDTAEVYGFGFSEEYVGEFMRQTGTSQKVVVGTKFAPLPWRQTPGSLVGACRKSLGRLGLPKMGLYIQHWPGFFLNAFANDAYLEGLAQVWEQGLAQAVGCSNFNAVRVQKAAAFLEARGTCLSSNQVQYSLIYRKPETNGVMEACREAGTTVVAYSPLCQGLLTGKYSMDNKPTGPRAQLFTEDRYRSVQVLLDCMKAVAEEQGGKTVGQVALNWTLCKGVVPIPGAKNARQVEEIAGALGWRLTDAQVAELDSVSKSVPPSTGAPFEAW